MLNLQQHVLVAESAREALDQAKSRVHSMAMLHEHLHKSPDVGQLKLGDYLEAVVAHATGLARSGLSLSVETKSDGCLVDLEQAVHIGLIVNELVTNAVKHAFPDQDQGAIVLTVREEVEEVLISVEDNGKGMVSGGLADHGSMGMQIVNALTEQIGATIALEGDHGTRWLLRVPEQSDTATQSH
jgi:two-component sensor histidine kinase